MESCPAGGGRSSPGRLASRSAIPWSEPASGETGPAQAPDEGGTTAHQVPQEAAAVVLDHQGDRPLVDPVVVGRHPAVVAPLDREAPVEGRLEAVRLEHAEIQPLEVPG